MYEVIIRRQESCCVRVAASSVTEAVEMALMMEQGGEIANYAYSDERVEVTPLCHGNLTL